MLKKVTTVAAILFLISLIGGVIMVPLALRDGILNGDTIISAFISSSEILTLDPAENPAIRLDFPHTNLVIEQSEDDHVYLRAEGWSGREIQFKTAKATVDGKEVLNISRNTPDFFFDRTVPSYLMRRSLSENTLHAVIVRIPPSVSLYTSSNSPRWHIRDAINNGVVFANMADYPSEREQTAPEPAYHERFENLPEGQDSFVTYQGLHQLLQRELSETISYHAAMQSIEPLEISQVFSQIANTYSTGMSEALLMDGLPYYDVLSARLSSYVTLRCQSAQMNLLLNFGLVDEALARETTAGADAAQQAFESVFLQAIAERDGTEPPAAAESAPALSPPDDRGFENEGDLLAQDDTPLGEDHTASLPDTAVILPGEAEGHEAPVELFDSSQGA